MILHPFNHSYANLTPAELEGEFLERLPETLSGADFLGRYGGTTDSATRVETGRDYPVRAATSHAVYEHARVREFAELLQQPLTDRSYLRLGELMYASHDGMTWTLELLDGAAWSQEFRYGNSSSVEPSLALSTAGRPHLTYRGANDLLYAWAVPCVPLATVAVEGPARLSVGHSGAYTATYTP